MSSMFSPKAPTPTPPPPLPDASGPSAMDAARKARAALMNGGGRSSTVLTGGAGTIGGGDYGGTKLGGA